VTPNSISWVWQPDGDPTEKVAVFQSYRLEIREAGSEADARIVQAPENPELGLYLRPNGGPDLTRSTIVHGLEPGRVYSATLVATDTSGCEFRSQTASAPQTWIPQSVHSIELFGETPFTGFALDATLVDQGCHVGSQCLRSPECSEPEPSKGKCAFNMRASGLDKSPAQLSAGGFAQAYLELWARNDAESPSYWSAIWLKTSDAGGEQRSWWLQDFTFRADGNYQRIQVPLGALADGEERLSFATISSGSIHELNFYNSVTVGSFIYVDEAYIRW
jgi:hypothetical protein